MGSFSLMHWIIVLVIISNIVAMIWGMIRVIHRAGRSGWLILLAFIPLFNGWAVLWFGYAKWPAIEGPRPN